MSPDPPAAAVSDMPMATLDGECLGAQSRWFPAQGNAPPSRMKRMPLKRARVGAPSARSEHAGDRTSMAGRSDGQHRPFWQHRTVGAATAVQPKTDELAGVAGARAHLLPHGTAAGVWRDVQRMGQHLQGTAACTDPPGRSPSGCYRPNPAGGSEHVSAWTGYLGVFWSSDRKVAPSAIACAISR